MLEAVTLIPGVEEIDAMTARFTYDDLSTVMRCCLAMLGLAAKELWASTP